MSDALPAALIWLLGCIPTVARPVAARTVKFALHLIYENSSMRGTLERMISQALHADQAETASLVEANLAHMAMLVMESVGARKLRNEWNRVCLDGFAHLQKAIDLGRGVILLTAHLGNYELILRGLPLAGVPLYSIGWRQSGMYHHRYMDRIRRFHGTKISYAQETSTDQALDILRGGGVLLLAGDHYPGRGRNVLPFFGFPTHLPAGPIHYHYLSGAPVVPVHTLREGREHRVMFEAPLPLPEGEDRYQKALELCVSLFEGWIRARPEQYLWILHYQDWEPGRAV